MSSAILNWVTLAGFVVTLAAFVLTLSQSRLARREARAAREEAKLASKVVHQLQNRLQMQTTLANSQECIERLRSLLGAHRDLVVQSDPDGCIAWVQRALGEVELVLALLHELRDLDLTSQGESPYRMAKLIDLASEFKSRLDNHLDALLSGHAHRRGEHESMLMPGMELYGELSAWSGYLKSQLAVERFDA